MYRYCAILWNTADLRATEAASLMLQHYMNLDGAWEEVARSNGICILHVADPKNKMGAIKINDENIILGQVCENAKVVDQRKFLKNTPPYHLKSADVFFTNLIENYWGDYLAFSRDQVTGFMSVFRSPFGMLPVLITKTRHLTIIFSDPNDLCCLTDIKFTISKRYLINNLIGYSGPRFKTGLNEVEQILPGQAIKLGLNLAEKTWIWSPNNVYKQSPVSSYSDARELMQSKLMQAVTASSEPYDSILLWLSGGLDSSLLLGLLAKSCPDKLIICVNNHYKGSGGDEREYARLAADRAQVPLIERGLSGENARLDLLGKVTPSATIDNYDYALFFASQDLHLAVSKGLRALFSGLAGDVVFFGFAEELAASDALRKYGIGPRFFKTCYNISRLRKSTVYGVAAQSVQMMFRDPASLEKKHEHPSIVPISESIQISLDNHPPLDLPPLTNLPYSKQVYVDNLYTNTIYYPPLRFENFPKPISPYYCQPVIEAGLQIPSYFLTKFGQNRGLIRDVFKDILPEEIRRRQAKGTTVSFNRNAVRSNASFILSYLLEGSLSKLGLINQNILTETLRDVDRCRIDEVHAVWNAFNLEIWIQAWASSGVTIVK